MTEIDVKILKKQIHYLIGIKSQTQNPVGRELLTGVIALCESHLPKEGKKVTIKLGKH